MDKDNVVRSSKFYMAKGDVLHILLRDWTCDFTIGLVDGDGNNEGTLPVQEGVDEVGFVSTNLGMLYNWYAIDDDREIAPEGWHVPTLAEIETLVAYLGGTSVAGGKLKETGFTYWNSPNTGATNEVVFSGRGAGLRDTDGSFSNIRNSLTLWSATALMAGWSYFRELSYNSAQIGGMDLAYSNNRGASLRLIKDNSTNPGYMIGNDGKVYPTVKIGDQVWMACNSAETKYRDTAFEVKYGILYNWYAATDVREIANTGWHVPTEIDFQTLMAYIEPGYDNLSNTIGRYLKEEGTLYWNNNLGLNTYGFNGRGSGLRTDAGLYQSLKTQGYLHSATEQVGDPLDNWQFRMESASATGRLIAADKNFGQGIRLIKNSTTLSHGETGTYTGNDGKVYRTICIGTQEWLADNLCETKYRNGDDIPEVTDNAAWAALATGAMCYYDNDIDNAFENLTDDIPEVTDNAAWAALSTGARCAYDNDEDNI